MAKVDDGGRWDFLDWLGQDVSAQVLGRLDDPADVVRAAAVSRSWRRFVIQNEFSKKLSLKYLPEVLRFTQTIEESTWAEEFEAGSSAAVELENQTMEHLMYTYLNGRLVALKNSKDRMCFLQCLGASSTDRYPDESIRNTLDPRDHTGTLPSYWSSEGQEDADVQECLVYCLNSELCLINEIRIRPFEAYFQLGKPIYSARSVRIRVGYPRLVPILESFSSAEDEAEVVEDSNFVWVYVSPEYEMTQENSLQRFKLPRPVLCIGGVLKIDLLGRVQRHFTDDLYYICICHVQVLGTPLSPALVADIAGAAAPYSVLRYFPSKKAVVLEDPWMSGPVDAWTTSDGGHINDGRGALGDYFNHEIMLPGEFLDEEEEDDWYEHEEM